MFDGADPNQEAIEAWNTVLFDKFSRFRKLVTEGLGYHGTLAIDQHVPATLNRVLDVGCGFGDTTLEIARKLGSGARVVGVDGAERFIQVAREDARVAGETKAEFAVADVGAADLGGPFELAFSRFGTMF
ncbi:MAG TPA: class I SAM-dependent methyltransferase, partial [Polyangiaceae bacterium]|nr:class I SAM-dependent methyltransferase [Polyangiaceae bacterium]